jgi:DNA-binding transcriptional LysR family regulator
MKIPRIEDLLLFVRAAESGGLSSAARELDMAPAAASAALKRLENCLAARLFVRSTRSLRLTVEGERYLVHARSVLQAIDEGAASVARDAQVIGGDLNLSMPSDLGRNVLLGWLDEFQQQYPAIRFRIRVSDRLADLYRQPVDIAIRYGAPEDSSMVALPLAASERVLCASPDYVKQHGMPKKTADLQQHNCLRFVLGAALGIGGKRNRVSIAPGYRRRLESRPPGDAIEQPSRRTGAAESGVRASIDAVAGHDRIARDAAATAGEDAALTRFSAARSRA